MTAVIDEFRISGPHAAGNPVLVLLHGRGSNEDDLLQLASLLNRDPTGEADPFTVVTPRAPWPGAPWGYGPGWAWYRYLGEDRPEPESLEGSLAALDDLMDGLEDTLGTAPGPIFLGGFSQGGTMSLAWSLSRPGRVAGAMNLSGFLADAPQVQDHLGNAEGLPVFWGHGRADPAIPFALGEKGRARLKEHEAALETFDHDGGHTITPGELEALRSWLRES
ncbi:MAG: alpha/beta fold hydrolase [Gemmatimonadales bacterium]|nr:MAG: alpha/beta fold hydrolase [Gemmatimonadales bacterium]